MSDGGKGSAPRPIEVPKDEFNRRWEETFGKQKTAYCPCCGGNGQVDTGIMESPVTVCNACNGTGFKDTK